MLAVPASNRVGGSWLLLLQSALNKDLPVLQSAALVLGLLYVLIMLAGDVTYRLLDPRIRTAVVT